MEKFDVHVTSVPDNHDAQIFIADIIVGTDRNIPKQIAVEMAKKPPVLLLRSVSLSEAELCSARFKEFGIGYHFSEIKTADGPDSAGDLNEFAKIKAHNVGVDRNTAAKPPTPAHFNTSKTGDIKASNTYNHSFSSGIRVGDLDALADLKAKEQKARRDSIVFSIVAIAVLLVIALVMLLMPKQDGNRFAGSRQQTTTVKNVAVPEGAQTQQQQQAQNAQSKQGSATAQAPSSPTAQTPPATPANNENSPDRQRNRVSNQLRQQASSYVDSARTAGSNMDNVVSFYRIAISFNRYNLAAWQGLLQAYRDQGMTKEARETEEQMLALFGEKVTSVNDLVRPFGELIDTYMSGDGTYRVEYKSNKRNRNDILNEVFSMTRSVRSACACENISIFASTGGSGRGMIAHSTPATSVHTLTAFSNQAQIIWLD